jgi:hypothetical protein
VHPWLCQKTCVQHQKPDAQNEGKNTRRPGDGVPQSALHDGVLFEQNTAAGFFGSRRFCVIYKESKHIEEPGEPGHYKNDVQRFDNGVIFHVVKIGAAGYLGFLDSNVKF